MQARFCLCASIQSKCYLYFTLDELLRKAQRPLFYSFVSTNKDEKYCFKLKSASSRKREGLEECDIAFLRVAPNIILSLNNAAVG